MQPPVRRWKAWCVSSNSGASNDSQTIDMEHSSAKVPGQQNAMAFVPPHHVRIIDGQELLGVVNNNHRIRSLVDALLHAVRVALSRAFDSAYRVANVSGYGRSAVRPRRNQANQEQQQRQDY
jgi:hypothetical protein